MEETRRGILKSARKKFLLEKTASEIAEQYTVLLKGTTSYIRFLELNDTQKKSKL